LTRYSPPPKPISTSNAAWRSNSIGQGAGHSKSSGRYLIISLIQPKIICPPGSGATSSQQRHFQFGKPGYRATANH
jgi:hypothetical protein